jgi:hypothetical protein
LRSHLFPKISWIGALNKCPVERCPIVFLNMRKTIGLVVVGFGLDFFVASFASQVRGNQPMLITSTLAEQQILNAQTIRQETLEKEEVKRFQQITEYATVEKLHQRPMEEILQAIAKQFQGTAYKAGLLDQSKEETLVVSLNKFDCVLFVETVLAIARGVAVQNYSYQTFVNHLRDQRYWDGQIKGYDSRLHYFSEWLFDNQKRGTVQNIGQDLGGVPLNKTLNFMSTHRQHYPQLTNDKTYKSIRQREAKLDGVTVDYIPTYEIHRVYAKLRAGDIVAIATNIPGLDVTHTGLVYRYRDGSIGFIHASPVGEVTIAHDLETYVGRVENAIGIIVARPIDPRHGRERGKQGKQGKQTAKGEEAQRDSEERTG